MSDLFASVNNEQITTARITFSKFGAWHGDLVLAKSNVVSGDITIEVGDLTLKGHAYRAASFAGARGVRFVGGHGGWQQQVKGQAYEQPSGVLVSHVLGDVATEVGEVLVLAQDKSLGAAWVREACVASRSLRQLVGETWWIDLDGTTQTKPRHGGAITSDFQVIDYSGARGFFVIATEVLADWMPGRTFTSPNVTTEQTIASSTIILGNDGKARVELLTNSAEVDAGDRLKAELLSLIREEDPGRTFHGVYEYSVDAVGSGTCDASPVDTTLSLPPITLIPETFPLMSATVNPGDLIRVWFVNGSPARPEVCSAPPDSVLIKVGMGTDFVALANKVTIELAKIAGALTTVANGGGALTGANPYTVPGSVSATQVKAN